MPQPTDPRILTNKNQAMLTVLRNTIDDMTSGDVSALRADTNGNLLVADPNLTFSAGRLLVDTEAQQAAVSQSINGLIESGTDTYELVPNIGPAPTGNAKFMGYLSIQSTGISNHDVTIKMYHYIDKGFMTYEKVEVASLLLQPPIGGELKVPFNQFDLTYAPDQIAPCNAPIGFEATCTITNSDTLVFAGNISILDGVSFTP